MSTPYKLAATISQWTQDEHQQIPTLQTNDREKLGHPRLQLGGRLGENTKLVEKVGKI